MRHSSKISVLLSLFVVLGVPCTVYSQPPLAPAPAGSADQADTLFRQGNTLYKDRRYAEAKAAFEQAFRLKKAHDIAANLAYAEMKLNLFRDAAEHLSLAVRIWPPTGKDDKRQYAVERLALVKKEVAMVTVQVNVHRAEVFVDGKSVGVAPLDGEVFVEPGSRKIEAKAAEYADAKQVLEATKGSAQTVTLALAPNATVPSMTATSSAAAAPTASSAPLDKIKEAEILFNVKFPDGYCELLTRTNGGDFKIGEVYFRLWSIEDVIEWNLFAEVQRYLPRTVAIGCDGSDMYYLLDYRGNNARPALIEIEAGSLCVNDFIVHGSSLEVAFRAWSGLDAARVRLLHCLAARAAALTTLELHK